MHGVYSHDTQKYIIYTKDKIKHKNSGIGIHLPRWRNLDTRFPPKNTRDQEWRVCIEIAPPTP